MSAEPAEPPEPPPPLLPPPPAASPPAAPPRRLLPSRKAPTALSQSLPKADPKGSSAAWASAGDCGAAGIKPEEFVSTPTSPPTTAAACEPNGGGPIAAHVSGKKEGDGASTRHCPSGASPAAQPRSRAMPGVRSVPAPPSHEDWRIPKGSSGLPLNSRTSAPNPIPHFVFWLVCWRRLEGRRAQPLSQSPMKTRLIQVWRRKARSAEYVPASAERVRLDMALVLGVQWIGRVLLHQH